MGDLSPSKWTYFSGLQPSTHPIELFLAFMENESSLLNYDESRTCSEAWRRITDGNTPAGVWKTAMATKYDQPAPKWSWQEMKADLLHAFGHQGAEYSLESKLQFLRSLAKDPTEPYSAFLFRVEWVLGAVGGTAKQELPRFWTKFMFLLGLRDVDQKLAVEMLNSSDGDIQAIISLLEETPPAAAFKSSDDGWKCKEEGESTYPDYDYWFEPDVKCEDYEEDDVDYKPAYFHPTTAPPSATAPAAKKMKRKREKESEEGSAEFSCTKCGEQFKSRRGVAMHRRTKHKDSNRRQDRLLTDDPMHVKARNTNALRKKLRTRRLADDEDHKTVKTMSSVILAVDASGHTR